MIETFLHSGKDRVSTVVIVAIGIPVGVSIVLFCMGFCFLRRRGRKNRESVEENDGKKHEKYFLIGKKVVSFLFCTLPKLHDNIFKNSMEDLLGLCSWR